VWLRGIAEDIGEGMEGSSMAAAVGIVEVLVGGGNERKGLGWRLALVLLVTAIGGI
jgi:hypothetical protein